jgi:hypothetical protein
MILKEEDGMYQAIDTYLYRSLLPVLLIFWHFRRALACVTIRW